MCVVQSLPHHELHLFWVEFCCYRLRLSSYRPEWTTSFTLKIDKFCFCFWFNSSSSWCFSVSYQKLWIVYLVACHVVCSHFNEVLRQILKRHSVTTTEIMLTTIVMMSTTSAIYCSDSQTPVNCEYVQGVRSTFCGMSVWSKKIILHCCSKML